MLDFCFGSLGLHRAQAFIHPDNTASIALVENLGFRREGLLRDNLRVGDVLAQRCALCAPGNRPGQPRLTSHRVVCAQSSRRP